MTSRSILIAAAFLAVGFAAPAPAQNGDRENGGDDAARERVIYEREVFRYDRAGRRDPFRSLLGAEDLAIRVDDLTLAGVVHNPDPRRSVAMLAERGSDRRFRVRVGDRVGGIRVQAIHPNRVDLLVDEFGVTRRESLQLRRPNREGGNE